MAFRKLVGSYKDYNLSTHILEDGYLAVDVDTGSLRLGDGSTAGGTAVAGGGGSSSSLGDLSAIGSTLSAPSNGDLTLTTAGTGSVIVDDTFKIGSGASVTTILDEDDMSSDSATALATQQSIKAYVDANAGSSTGGISFSGTTISTTDSSAGIEIAGNLIPSQNGVFQLGSSNRRWQTVYLAAETIDLGGATISSDGTGEISIAATGATLPTGSKVKSGDTTQGIQLQGKTSATANRPIQLVNVYTSDGSTSFTDAELLAKTGDLELEFNGTIEEIPVYTEAGQTFTLSGGGALSDQYSSRNTLFQF